MSHKTLIGQTEQIGLPELTAEPLYARIDSGAKTAAVWVSYVEQTGDGLAVVFFGETSPYYTGQKVLYKHYDRTVVASSSGHVEERFKVRLLVNIGGRRVRAWFTLADRSNQMYPVLIGRNVLRGKFIVDVSIGSNIISEQLRPDRRSPQERLENAR